MKMPRGRCVADNTDGIPTLLNVCLKAIELPPGSDYTGCRCWPSGQAMGGMMMLPSFQSFLQGLNVVEVWAHVLRARLSQSNLSPFSAP